MKMQKRRADIPESVTIEVLTACRRRCCLCWALDGDASEKRGQIVHLDQNPRNNKPDNLAFLCLRHHDEYDSRTRQSKGLIALEVKRYREELVRVFRNRFASLREAHLQIQLSGIASTTSDTPNFVITHDHAARWLAMEHWRRDGLDLEVVAADYTRCDRDPLTLRAREKLRLRVDRDGRPDLWIEDGSGVPLGEVLNRSGLSWENFAAALERCYGTLDLAVEFCRILSLSPTPKWCEKIYIIRVVQEPVVMRKPGRYTQTWQEAARRAIKKRREKKYRKRPPNKTIQRTADSLR